MRIGQTAAVAGVLLLAALQDADAMRPPESTHLGIEPHRVHHYTQAGQAMLRTTGAWQDFSEGEGKGWQVRFDEATRTPARMWGPGIAVDTTSAQSVSRDVLAFAQRHAGLLGVDGAQLEVRSANAFDDAWYVDVDVYREGLPLWRAGLSFRIKFGNLVMVGADSYPDAPVLGSMVLSEQAAIDAAIRLGPAAAGEHTDVSASAWLLPMDDGGKPVLRTVWEVKSRTKAPLGHWVAFVDAETGELVNVHNEIRFFDGHISAQRDNRTLTGTTITDLPFADISGGGASTYTDAGGNFSISGNGPFQVELSGQRVNIRDQLGTVRPSISGTSVTLDSSDFSNRNAPLTTYTYLHEVQDFAYNYQPRVSFTRDRMDAFININDACNAYFDGDVNFFLSGSGCNNTGRQADVIFHEWGHGFHQASIQAGWYDGSLGEGAADVISFLMTDDSRIAPVFFQGGGGTLRNVDNSARYPDDYSNSEALIHTNGLIFGGSLWDTREALRRTQGEPYATDATAQIYTDTLKGGPDIEGSFDEAMFADDDDGNLGNGTPHLCELIEGFGLHGLGLAGDWAMSVDHEVLVEVAPESKADVVAAIASPAPECLSGTDTRAGKIHWRMAGGDDWASVDLELNGAGVAGELPPFEYGDVVEYWLSLEGPDGLIVFDPPGGEIRPHTFYVGGVIEVQCDDFETDDGGFTHELVSGEATEGANDWQWGEPGGLAGDPSAAWSGNNIWGNDLGGEGWNGEYQNDKVTRLTSPVYDLEHYQGAMLHYRRWLAVEDGYYDRATITANDEVVWSNWATNTTVGDEHHLDDGWAAHAVDLTRPAQEGQVQVSWSLESDGGLTFGGWNIDDVCMYVPATPNNRLAILDLAAEPVDDIGGVRLTWTNPRHAPLQRVRVVRKSGAWPLGADDGALVAELNDVEVDVPVEIVDEEAQGRKGLYYAAYGYDGEEWLGWTVEGRNAVLADAGTYDPPKGIDPLGITADPVGCGCSNGTGTGGFAWLLGLVGLLARRRSHPTGD